MEIKELVEKLDGSLAALEFGVEPNFETLGELVTQVSEALASIDDEKLVELLAEDETIADVLEQVMEMETKASTLYDSLKTEREQAESAKIERQAALIAKLAEKTGKKVDVVGVEEEAKVETPGDLSKGSSKIEASKLAATLRSARELKPETPSTTAPGSDKNHRIYADSNYVDTFSGARLEAAGDMSWSQLAKVIADTGNTNKSIAKVVFEKGYDFVDNTSSDSEFIEKVLDVIDERQKGDLSVTSASSICAREQDFSVDNLSSGCSKFVNSLTTIRSRRVMNFFRNVYADLSGQVPIGGFEWTDADYDDPNAEKPCLPANCGVPLGCDPVSLGWCFEVNRFQELSHAEQVAALKQLMNVYFQYRLENYALASYASTVSALPFDDGGVFNFGANIDFAQKIGLIISQLSATIGYYGDWDVWLPTQAYHKLAGDRLASPLRELSNLENAINADGTAGARVRLGEYCGTAAGGAIAPIAGGGGQPFTSPAFGAQALPTVTAGPPVTVTPGTGGTIPSYPLINRVLIAPAGAGVRNVLGDVSIETRETITKNNRKKLLYEQDNQICWRKEHWIADLALCDSGKTGAFYDKKC